MLLDRSMSNSMAMPCRVSSPICRSNCGPAQAAINSATATARSGRTRRSQRSRPDGGTSRHTANPDTVIAARGRLRSAASVSGRSNRTQGNANVMCRDR